MNGNNKKLTIAFLLVISGNVLASENGQNISNYCNNSNYTVLVQVVSNKLTLQKHHNKGMLREDLSLGEIGSGSSLSDASSPCFNDGVKRGYLDSIYFPFDSYSLNKESKVKIEKMVNGFPSQTDIYIVGNTDKVGTNTYNLQLGLKRASVIKKYIIHNHPNYNGHIHISSRGELSPISSINAYNRRSEIRY